ncbi:hypothetical protein NQT69_08350 [Pseudoalteromonas shioyasakiensis]|uniref:hypothetical protein n=1 Tax=Pseudoalteromonas shioyasakiensis TaxID=1190813 RepID=UPI002119996C|nr:hypothetical protein [Pseudoalteromonas shioyasakiensis]MCQ8878004.1 hypothetical protein [Pseudoalteromonas shioyasakiensis]
MQYRLLLHSAKFLLIGIILSFIVWLISSQQVENLELGQLNTYECKVAASQGELDFNLYIPSNWHVFSLADELCRNTLKGSVYNKVMISWQPRDTFSSELIMKQTFNVMLYREHALTGLLPNWQDFYQHALDLPNYQLYWFSHQDNIAITPEFFAHKHVGLLADKKSATGYLSPLSEMSQAGINLPAQQIHLYPNREALIDDFLKEKLDLIPSPDHHVDLINWPKNKKHLLTEPYSQVGWLVSKNTEQAVLPKIKKSITKYQKQLFSEIIQPTVRQPESTPQ